MAMCVFGGISHSGVAAKAGHGAHAGGDGIAMLTAIGVLALAAWTASRHVRREPRSWLGAVESWAMTIGAVVMWLAH